MAAMCNQLGLTLLDAKRLVSDSYLLCYFIVIAGVFRVPSYSEIEDRFIKSLAELERRPLNEESIVEKGSLLLFGSGV